MKTRMWLVALAMTAAAGSPGARDRITIRVSPAVAFAPANLVVRAVIPNDTENRAIEIIADSDEFYRSSEVPLDGERAPLTTTFEFRSVPGGIYEVRAVLKGSRGEQLASTATRVSVF
jgi:hypothetical protein